MLKRLQFTVKYRCFESGDRFDFRPGVNLLVGEQGTGKSTIYQCIQKNDKKVCAFNTSPMKMFSFDFERDTSRGKAYFNDSQPMMAQVSMLFSSHGEVVRSIINMLNKLDKEIQKDEHVLILMDEPDMALSIRSCHNLVQVMQSIAIKGHQIIASVHNPTVISQFDEVLSLEHRRWMRSKDFIASHAVAKV